MQNVSLLMGSFFVWIQDINVAGNMVIGKSLSRYREKPYDALKFPLYLCSVKQRQRGPRKKGHKRE